MGPRFSKTMALGIAAPADMDDLAPYRASHRVLGHGIALGGVLAGAAGSAYLSLGASSADAIVGAALAGLVVALAGLLHATVGANAYQARAARKLGRAPGPAGAVAHAADA